MRDSENPGIEWSIKLSSATSLSDVLAHIHNLPWSDKVAYVGVAIVGSLVLVAGCFKLFKLMFGPGIDKVVEDANDARESAKESMQKFNDLSTAITNRHK